MTTTSPTEMLGILRLDRWGNRIDGDKIVSWVENRVNEMPDGALVRLTLEVIDPHPPESQKPEYACEECKDTGIVHWHDPSGDGHGGLNGGAWKRSACDCPAGIGQRWRVSPT